MTYQEFLRVNRIKMNTTMNHIIWTCLVSAPVLFFCSLMGLWTGISHRSLLQLFIINLAIALVHTFLIKRKPESMITSVMGLFVIDGVLVYLSSNRFGIYLMFYFVPLLSILFINKRLYILASVWTYLMMCVSSAIISDFHASVRIDYDSPVVWFFNYVSGITIEMIIMFLTGYMICSFMERYIREKYSDEQRLQDQIAVLNAMNAIYELILLIDYKNNTVTTVEDGKQRTDALDSLEDVFWDISEHVVEDDERLFRIFTNIHSLKHRLKGKNNITAEFRSEKTGWKRARFMDVRDDSNGEPEMVVFTLHDIDEEKKEIESYEQELRRDALTELHNRKMLREDIDKKYTGKLDEDLLLFVVELNAIKEVNKRIGIEEGDLYINSVADCMKKVFGDTGEIYRVGGDQFVAIIHNSTDPSQMAEELKSLCRNWNGSDKFELSVSIGYAASRDNPDCDITELGKVADKVLFKEKAEYYSNPEYDRRRG
ncbi:MAG: GGDEF domain-containing protein [Lachnospiraceae bacterium]|nr:GGDEF domain-containing protein [Lachnospiraceae bacterium]